MKKRVLALIALACLLLIACSDEALLAETLNSAVAGFNSTEARGGEYMLEINYVGEAGSSTLYYARGDFACDGASKRAYTSFDQSYLGYSSKAENYFSGGRVVTVADGEVIETTRDPDELFASFPYFKVCEYDDTCKSLRAGNNARGDVYTYTRAADRGFCESVVGKDISAFAYMLKQPQADRTAYGDIECSVTVSDGVLLSFGCEFDATVYDTQAYIPGYSQPESDYTATLHIAVRISYSDGMEIKEYSE